MYLRCQIYFVGISEVVDGVREGVQMSEVLRFDFFLVPV